ncbi:hypothetical protein Ancab_017370 [Ancistrocladus abbreviatus]
MICLLCSEFVVDLFLPQVHCIFSIPFRPAPTLSWEVQKKQKNHLFLYDPSSAPAHPLLSKPYPSPSIEEQSPHPTDPTFDSDHTQFLHICYNHGPRLLKDLPFPLLFSLLSLCAFGFGIFSIIHENSNYSDVSSNSYNSSSSSCVENSSLSVALNHGSSFSFRGLSNFDSFCFGQ